MPTSEEEAMTMFVFTFGGEAYDRQHAVVTADTLAAAAELLKADIAAQTADAPRRTDGKIDPNWDGRHGFRPWTHSFARLVQGFGDNQPRLVEGSVVYLVGVDG